MFFYFLKGKIAGCVHLWFNEAGAWRTAQPQKTVLTALKALTSFTSKGVAGRHQRLPTLFCLSVNGSGFWRTTNIFLFFLSFTKHFLSVPLLLGKYSLKFIMITVYVSARPHPLVADIICPSTQSGFCQNVSHFDIMEQKYSQLKLHRANLSNTEQ